MFWTSLVETILFLTLFLHLEKVLRDDYKLARVKSDSDDKTVEVKQADDIMRDIRDNSLTSYQLS